MKTGLPGDPVSDRRLYKFIKVRSLFLGHEGSEGKAYNEALLKVKEGPAGFIRLGDQAAWWRNHVRQGRHIKKLKIVLPFVPDSVGVMSRSFLFGPDMRLDSRGFF